jgi:hypothetical protein
MIALVKRLVTERGISVLMPMRPPLNLARAWRGTIDIEPGRNYPRSSPTSRATAYN